MDNVKQVPYGVADFVSVRERNLYYVDKTMYLAELERQPDTLIFIRPRRFGKSLFISMMRAYYDKAMQDKFDSLFGDLWIGQHPTPLKGRYQVLYLDFSQVGGTSEQLPQTFKEFFEIQLDEFMRKYQNDYPADAVEAFFSAPSYVGKMAILSSNSRELRIPLYLIIDEYDNFTNVVLNEEGEAIYHAMTHASGFYREVFKKFKGNFERIFMTGVSPVTLDDLTSGFNIGWNVSTKRQLDRMLGFSTDDVRTMFNYFKAEGKFPADSDVEAMITEMKPWYDNYCFSEGCLVDGNHVFNCDMVLYYLRNCIDDGCSPKQMIDPNTKTDYDKLKKLIQLDQLDGDRKSVLHKIAENGFIYSNLAESFPASGLTNPDNFISLLFYYGMLTITDTYGATLKLSIPNNNVRKQYYGYLMSEYQNIRRVNVSVLNMAYADAAIKGQWRTMMEYILNAYKETTSVRSLIEGERNIQGFMNAYFNLNPYYVTAPEVEVNHGYCDFFMMPELHRYPMIAHSYIIELKYLKKEDTAEYAAQQWAEAVEQIHGYSKGERVRLLTEGTQLHLVVAQIKGCETIQLEEIL